jgi:thioredoxin-like negative regulator of GroEL
MTGSDTSETRPTILFFRSARCGRSRRLESLLAQVLQKGRNHSTFRIRRVDVDDEPLLAERWHVERTPVLAVIADRRVAARLDVPRNVAEIRRALSPWLRPPARPLPRLD